MERVGTLLQKLNEQYERKAPAEQLLLTIQQLHAELAHLQQGSGRMDHSISVTMPSLPEIIAVEEKLVVPVEEPPVLVKEEPPVAAADEEKTFEVLQIDEAEVEAELEEIKRKAEEMQRMSVHHKPVILFEPEDEPIPTFAHQEKKVAVKEVHETIAEEQLSLNDKLKQSKMELGEQLVETPIRDLKKAIGVNDRFLYITELFRGDEIMYERSIKTINGFTILPEAEYWIQRELKVKLGWDENSPTLKQFNQLIKRRFS